MSRPSASAQCDSVASYMDGVQVKIAEAYKPPRRIALPAAYNNKLPDLSRYNYEFSLEKTVLGKMEEWCKARRAISEVRQARMEKKKKEEEEIPPVSPPATVKQSKVNSAPAPETTILTPQPLTAPANDLSELANTNGLDLADFDNDTSSPFDNMELKTINDMEELAQVLQPTSQWIPSAKLESTLSELNLGPMDQSQDEEKQEPPKMQTDNNTDNNEHSKTGRRSIPIIVQELQRELARPIMENWKPWPDLESPDIDIEVISPKANNTTTSNNSVLCNPLPDLSEDDQKLAKHLSDMGFPLPRAARAIRDLGGHDNKKVVEYLLAVQSLEEIGIPGDDAEKALALTEYDQDKAKMYHENLRTLRDLGFPEDQASMALLKCNIDRDQALDFLIS